MRNIFPFDLENMEKIMPRVHYTILTAEKLDCLRDTGSSVDPNCLPRRIPDPRGSLGETQPSLERLRCASRTPQGMHNPGRLLTN